MNIGFWSLFILKKITHLSKNVCFGLAYWNQSLLDNVFIGKTGFIYIKYLKHNLKEIH